MDHGGDVRRRTDELLDMLENVEKIRSLRAEASAHASTSTDHAAHGWNRGGGTLMTGRGTVVGAGHSLAEIPGIDLAELHGASSPAPSPDLLDLGEDDDAAAVSAMPPPSLIPTEEQQRAVQAQLDSQRRELAQLKNQLVFAAAQKEGRVAAAAAASPEGRVAARPRRFSTPQAMQTQIAQLQQQNAALQQRQYAPPYGAGMAMAPGLGAPGMAAPRPYAPQYAPGPLGTSPGYALPGMPATHPGQPMMAAPHLGGQPMTRQPTTTTAPGAPQAHPGAMHPGMPTSGMQMMHQQPGMQMMQPGQQQPPNFY